MKISGRRVVVYTVLILIAVTLYQLSAHVYSQPTSNEHVNDVHGSVEGESEARLHTDDILREEMHHVEDIEVDVPGEGDHTAEEPEPSDAAAVAPTTEEDTAEEAAPTEKHRTDTETAPVDEEVEPPAEQLSAKPPRQLGVYVKPKSNKVEDNQLTAELAGQYAENNVIMVTWANHHYHDFVRNWVLNVRKCKVTNFLVGAMDNELLNALIDDKVPTFAMQSGMTTKDFGWGTENFHKMGRKKIELIHLFTTMGFDILVSDVDTVWMQNPMPYMAKYPTADILTSSDHLANTAKDGGLENPQVAYSPANIGIMLLRHTAKDLAKEWVEVLEKDDKVWDQNAFNDLYRRGSRGAADKDNLIFGYKGNLKVGILPVSIFASGHTYFVQRMHEKLGLEPYVVHATFQFSGTEGKRHRMREALLWQDAPEYYNPAGGLLTFAADIPDALLKASGTVEGHFNLVNHQILQIRNALAISSRLGRTLVMPKLWCGFDRWWAPHHGKIPGSETELPYLCPMDHVFEVETWLRPMPANEAGPNIGFREYSFFDNPSVPKEVLDSKVTVELVDTCGADKGSACSNGVGVAAPRTMDKIVTFKNFTDVDIEHLLENHKDTKVLHFSTMVGAFSGFESQQNTQHFSNRLKRYAGLWCCIHAHPGHMWYDMEFDVIPHTDRHNRLWNKKWEPKAGP
mmetsp:Transcript_35964/g.88593  ORF Transcript_35964/g.88593 Transcript_35964/m.88593 type:complete len:683 (-) Transcript_35964:285-2333(-)